MRKPENLEDAHRRLVEQHGAWTGYNLDLGGGVFTMGPGLVGAGELSVRRTLQVVTDVVGSLEGLRVLDLGTLEGLYAIECALRGAEVVAVEGREANLAKARFARDALGLQANLELVHGDLREVTLEHFGEFDVVLCLGVLYHLDPPAAFRLVHELGRMTRRLAVVETQVGLVGRRRYRWRGRPYRGRLFAEDQRHLWASIANDRSLWLTKPSLLNLLAASGFTSVTDALVPLVAGTARFRDHVVLCALKGERTELAAAHQVNALGHDRWPEAMARTTHPGQRVGVRLRARLGRRLMPVFRKRRI